MRMQQLLEMLRSPDETYLRILKKTKDAKKADAAWLNRSNRSHALQDVADDEYTKVGKYSVTPRAKKVDRILGRLDDTMPARARRGSRMDAIMTRMSKKPSWNVNGRAG